MSLNWSISCKLQSSDYVDLEGVVKKIPSLTYEDLLNLISKKHDIHPNCIIHSFKLKDKINNNISCIKLEYDSDQYSKSTSKIKFKIPDYYNFYQPMLIKIHIYVRNPSLPQSKYSFSFWNQIEKKQIQIIVKVIKETCENYIVKLPDYYSINWGQGPTLPSLYACLKKNPQYVSPVPLESKFEYIIIKYVKEYNNEYDNYNMNEWQKVEQDICAICTENTANIYCYCETPHIVCCSMCIENLEKCPICYEKIVDWTKVDI